MPLALINPRAADHRYVILHELMHHVLDELGKRLDSHAQYRKMHVDTRHVAFSGTKCKSTSRLSFALGHRARRSACALMARAIIILHFRTRPLSATMGANTALALQLDAPQSLPGTSDCLFKSTCLICP